MKIGELARITSCTPETIRFYEKEGLLSPPLRQDNNYRCYKSEHVEQLRFIRNCRSLDMAHEEIHALLLLMNRPLSDCTPVNHLLDQHIEHVDVRLQELEVLRTQLLKLRQQCACAQPIEDCGIIQGLSTMPTQEKRASASHLG